VKIKHFGAQISYIFNRQICEILSFNAHRSGLANLYVAEGDASPHPTAHCRRVGLGNVSIMRAFVNPILTVMWLGFFHINASSGLFNVK